MTRTDDDGSLPRRDSPAGGGPARPPPCVLLVDLEPALATLLAEWLQQDGVAACVARGLRTEGLPRRPELLVTDIAFPRQGPTPRLQALGLAWPGTPILALSPTVFAGRTAGGETARRLGVAALLATPLAREDWLAAVRRLLPAAERPA